jgi:L,D-transpeptidase catalytic domain
VLYNAADGGNAGGLAEAGECPSAALTLLGCVHYAARVALSEHVMLHRVLIAFATTAALLGGLASAQAGVVITVNKSTQRLHVEVNGVPRYDWPVSTARMGYNTPNGSYRPERLARKWFSRKYGWSPMPYSIFFDGGYAIHGSYEISHLGRPASHGCIRLHPKHAAVLFALVQENQGATRIVVTGERPSRAMLRSERRPRYVEDDDARPPRSIRSRSRAPRYVEDDDMPTSSLRGSRMRYRHSRGIFEEIFN